MIRKIIKIDQALCNGCGLCATACHENAIGMVNQKATLLRDDYCDGLGDCLPVCPTGAITFEEREAEAYDKEAVEANMASKTQLRQWPVQIKLVPLKAPYFNGAHLLVAADCSAFSYGSFHKDFMKDKVTLIGCPKLDSGDYSEKLTEILKANQIEALTVIRMEVPCCGGIEHAAVSALKNSRKNIPLQVITLTTDGRIL